MICITKILTNSMYSHNFSFYAISYIYQRSHSCFFSYPRHDKEKKRKYNLHGVRIYIGKNLKPISRC